MRQKHTTRGAHMIKIVLPLILTILSIGYYAFVHAHRTTIPQCPSCNVLIIAIDGIRADELPCLGYARNTMPNLCAFANHATIAPYAVSASIDLPTSQIATLLSLRPEQEATQSEAFYRHAQKKKPVVNILQQHGFFTEFIGHQPTIETMIKEAIPHGFTSVPTTQSIQDWHMALETFATNTQNKTPSLLYLQNTDLIDTIWTDIATATNAGMFNPTMEKPKTLSESSINAEVKNATKDYFDNDDMPPVYTTLFSQIDRLTNQNDITAFLSTLSAADQFIIHRRAIQNAVGKTNPVHLQYLKDRYDAMLHHVDSSLGTILSYINDEQLTKNTIIIFVSHTGFDFGRNTAVTIENTVYPTITHVPLIISVPKNHTKQLMKRIELIDIMPTLLDILHIAPINAMDGTSFAHML